MSWANRTKAIHVGDTVCYSRQFLRNTGQQTGDIPFARGKVTSLIKLGETMLAEIEWNQPDVPPRVNVANLSRVTTKGIAEET